MKEANNTLQKLRDYITDPPSLMSRAILIWNMILARVSSFAVIHASDRGGGLKVKLSLLL